MGNGRDPRGTEPKEDPGRPAEAALRFGGGRVAVAGVMAGLCIALGVPAVLLCLGQSLGQVVLTILVVMALAGGALVCLVSAFFGLVIPRHLHRGPWMDPDKWRRFAMEQRRWHDGHRRRGAHWGPSADFGGEEDGGDGEEGKAAAPRRRRGAKSRG